MLIGDNDIDYKDSFYRMIETELAAPNVFHGVSLILSDNCKDGEIPTLLIGRPGLYGIRDKPFWTCRGLSVHESSVDTAKDAPLHLVCGSRSLGNASW